MANRLMVVPSVGEVVMSKRRGARNIRITITAAGQVRVALPHWTPYAAGVHFVKKHEAWIRDQLRVHAPNPLTDGVRIGRSHRIRIEPSGNNSAKQSVRVSRSAIVAKVPEGIDESMLQKKLLAAAERALKQEADELLSGRLVAISRRYGLPYSGLKIRKLTSRWGSCSSKKQISLSYFLVQLPNELIDYVILHELAHTIHHNHSSQFWGYMDERLADLDQLRREIKLYRPRVEPYL